MNFNDMSNQTRDTLMQGNGQTAAAAHDANAGGVPTIPTKPVRHTILAKREQQIGHQSAGVGQGAADDGTDRTNAPVANTAEADEIEFLLDEIKDLEVPACRTDSEQDFEIDGSRVDLDLSLHLDSPIDTSWYYFSILFGCHVPSQRLRIRIGSALNVFWLTFATIDVDVDHAFVLHASIAGKLRKYQFWVRSFSFSLGQS